MALREDSVVAAAPADSALATALDLARARLDSVFRDSSASKSLLTRFARLSGGRVVVLADSAEWPDDTEVSFGVLRLRDGFSLGYEIPHSESGDWFNVYTHYFDPSGRVFAFERHSSFFIGCDDVNGARETATTLYAGDGRIMARRYVLEAFDTTKAITRDQCEFLMRWPYTIQRSLRMWRRVNSLDGAGRP
jgi:hypothetical protein